MEDLEEVEAVEEVDEEELEGLGKAEELQAAARLRCLPGNEGK